MPTLQQKPLNQTQLHILEMFSYSSGEREMKDLKQVLAAYYAQKVQNEADKLYEEGILDADNIEKLLSEHLRTPYNA